VNLKQSNTNTVWTWSAHAEARAWWPVARVSGSCCDVSLRFIVRSQARWFAALLERSGGLLGLIVSLYLKTMFCVHNPAQCFSTGCIVHTKVYQNFPGVYHRDGVYRSVPDVCSPRTVTSPHIQCSLAQCANLSQALKSYTGECKLSLFSRLFVGNVGQVTITYPS